MLKNKVEIHIRNKKMPFIAVLLLAVCTVNAEVPLIPVQQYDNENDYVIETVGNGLVARITNYNGTKTEIRIPMQIRRMPIVGIREKAFNNKGFTSVAIPNSVILIESNAFSENEITQISIGTNVTCHEDSFDSGFVQFYNENGRRAGTYIYRNGRWTIQTAVPSPDDREIPVRTSNTASKDDTINLEPYVGFSFGIGLWDYGPSMLNPRTSLHLGLLLSMGNLKIGLAGEGGGFLGPAFPSFEDAGISYGFYFGSFIEVFFNNSFGFGLGGGITKGYFTTRKNIRDDYFFPFAEFNIMLGNEDDSLGIYFRYYFNDSDKFYNKFAIGIRKRNF